MTDDKTPEEEPEASSRAAGACIVLVLAAVPLAVVFAVSKDAGILTVWGVGAGVLWWLTCRRRKPVQDTAGPAPPPLPEGAAETKPQFTVVPDETNPHRSHVVWTTKENS